MMGKAIIVLSVVVLFCFAFVLAQLSWGEGPGGDGEALAAPLLESREDGSVYSVGLRVRGIEDRVLDEEKRSQKLRAELDLARKDNRELRGQIEMLVGEIRDLRRDLDEKTRIPMEPSTLPSDGNSPGLFSPAPAGPGPAADPLRP